MSKAAFRPLRFVSFFLTLCLPCLAQGTIRIYQEHPGFGFDVSTQKLRLIRGEKWVAGPDFLARNPQGDLLVGPFVLDRVDSSSGSKIWSSEKLPLVPASLPFYLGTDQIRRDMPIHFQRDGRGWIRGPVKFKGFSAGTRWKDVMVGSGLEVEEAHAVDSVVLVDSAWRLRIRGDSKTRIANGVVAFSHDSRMELGNSTNPEDSSGFQWMSGQESARQSIHAKEGWKAKARWGNLEMDLLVHDRKLSEPIRASILSLRQFLDQDTIGYKLESEVLASYRGGEGRIHCPWDSSFENSRGWRYRGKGFRWSFRTFQSPLLWSWSELSATKAGQNFAITTSPPWRKSAPWDTPRKEAKPDVGWMAPPLDPVETFANLWWTAEKDWRAEGRIPGIGKIRYERSFRWKGKDSLVLRGTLSVDSAWRGILGDSALVDALVATQRHSRDAWMEPANHPIGSFKIASDHSVALGQGKTLRSMSGGLWWEPADHGNKAVLKAVTSCGRILVADSVLATRVDSVYATPRLVVVPGRHASKAPTMRTEHGIVVLLERSLDKPIPVSTPTFPCSAFSDWFPEIVNAGLFQEPSVDFATKWEFYQPVPFLTREIGGEAGDCVERRYGNSKCCPDYSPDDELPFGVRCGGCLRMPILGEGGFRSAFLEGFLARAPVALSVEDVRIAVEQELHPLPALYRLEADSLVSKSRLIDGFRSDSIPTPLRAFWNSTGPQSQFYRKGPDSMLTGPTPNERIYPNAPGIPWVRLSSDTTAWNLLLQHVDSMASRGNQTAIRLRPVVEGLATSASGHASQAFWDGFVHGKGGEKGWLWRLDPRLARNPMMAVRLDRREPVGSLFAGFVGILRDSRDSCLRPRKLWLTIPYEKHWENPYGGHQRCDGSHSDF